VRIGTANASKPPTSVERVWTTFKNRVKVLLTGHAWGIAYGQRESGMKVARSDPWLEGHGTLAEPVDAMPRREPKWKPHEGSPRFHGYGPPNNIKKAIYLSLIEYNLHTVAEPRHRVG